MKTILFSIMLLSSPTQADTAASGGLGREEVREVILSHKMELRRCFEDALESNPNAQGRIQFKWKIAPSGRITEIEIKESDLNDGNFETCVSKVVLGMIFPKAPNGLPTSVIYPFTFRVK